MIKLWRLFYYFRWNYAWCEPSDVDIYQSSKLNMENSQEFLGLVLDSITEHIVVIDKAGDIQFVNKSWSLFGNNNACVVGDNWSGVNYIEECDKASAMGDAFGAQAGDGIRRVINRDISVFYFEYPCHSLEEKRWFMMRVTSFEASGKDCFVISHQNITERKLAEEEVVNLAKIDRLTDIANRRTFDEFLKEEWIRCTRLKKPMSLALIDLDYFKLLNDTYGHLVGDECLVQVAGVLQKFTNRPADLCARFGGEEFAIIWGDTSLIEAKQLSSKLLAEIKALDIENKKASGEGFLTASIGLATVIPVVDGSENELVSAADRKLYKAKEGGRNRIAY